MDAPITGARASPFTIRRTECFRLGTLLFVPHYTNPNYYVAPGGRTESRARLIEAGAETEHLMLWERSYLVAKPKELQP